VTKKLLSAIALALTLSMAVAACGGSDNNSSSGSSSGPLVGAGSTLVAPLVSKWQPDFSDKSGITVTYGAIGSGGGIDQITARTSRFRGRSAAPFRPTTSVASVIT
jgi:phosphate transport system substrate-binding protein